jgi:DNA repair protein RecN (Recombination protein N)
MLAQLSIRNFALIEALTLEFHRGFNALTGETGAGKSILIDAITAALGERTSADWVRAGSDRASIEAVFEVGQYPLPAVQEWAEDGVVIMGREVSASGRSTFRINGRMSTASTVRSLAADLIDIHGQHDHQSLLSPERHVEFLDAWAGGPIAELRRQAQAAYTELRAVHRERDSLLRSERERAQQLDLFRFQADEIDAAEPSEAEEEALQAERGRLANAEKLFAAGGSAREALSDGEFSALDRLHRAARDVETLAALDPGAEPVRELLETALASAQEAGDELRRYLDLVEVNPGRLAEVQERLEIYRSLKRKYGDTVAEILAYRDSLSADLERLGRSEERRDQLDQQIRRLETDTDLAAAALFEARRAAADRFEREIAAHLADLNMERTRFCVELGSPSPAREAWERGLSEILGPAEFLLSANPGEPLRPLARIASGGEMSRVMLALKTAMAGSHPVALIFDEIDSGVGGKTAERLGAKMADLSRSNQVLCVTHLPQIASLADRHLQVLKGSSGERTLVQVRTMEGEARVDELARMLGGSASTAAQHARELLASPVRS